MTRALFIASIALLVVRPVLAQRSGGGHGGGVRGGMGGGMHGGFGGGMHGGFGGMRPGFGGNFHRGFHQQFHNNLLRHNIGRPLSPFPFGSPGFGGGNADQGYPFDYGYPDYPEDNSRYDSSNIGYQPSVSKVVEVQLSEHISSYVPVDDPTASVAPAIHGYRSTPSQTGSTDSPTVYLIAFRDNTIRLALAYWTQDSTLRYVTPNHEQKQAPLISVDRALSERLNGERHVPFHLPSS